ncbi:MAG: glycosyltransferase family 9 protein [Candidatus Omnitrophica bacterium]|nr:glycosyltransferase family 9 protein [Candidatus Omnitrophota bacterium]
MTFQNILIVRTDRIGDVVLTTPAIKALRRAYQTARISVLVTPQTYDLVDGNPYVDEILVDDRQGRHKDLFGFVQLTRDIRLKKFDLVIIFHTKRRYNLACYTAGIPYRLGYKNNKFGSLLTHPLKDERHLGTKHEAQYCLQVLKAIGIESNDLDIFVPSHKNAEEWVAKWMKENNLRSNEIIVIHPGSSDAAKCWPAAQFASLMDRLAECYTLKIVLIGSQETKPVAAQILQQARLGSRFLDLTGKTSLGETVSLLRHARLLISNDSGPVHVAAGVGTHVISLFLRNQPGINIERWKPLGPNSYVLPKSQAVSGELLSISVESVLELTEQIFRRDNQYEIF